jgi:uncharacterized small protein (DUF1192 family)
VADAIRELSVRIGELEQRLATLQGETELEAGSRVTELRPKQGPSSAGG